MDATYPQLNPQVRIMLTPGPSMIHPRVYRAMVTPIIGHLDYRFMGIMDEVQTMLRNVMRTKNKMTIPLSASGSGAIEASMINFLEPGDTAIICVAGHFAERMAEVASRIGANVIRVEAPWGQPVDPQKVREAAKGKKVRVVGMVQGETSTGVFQPIGPYRGVADECGALLVVDAVATVAGIPLDVDEERIDVCFSGTQKCLSAPPGMAPITVGPRGEEVLSSRKSKVPSWYLDLTVVQKYWGKDRTYHHTPPISLIFGLHEALRLVEEEGLEARWQRHKLNSQALVAGLEAMGLEMVAAPEHRLVTVIAVKAPAGIEEAKVRRRILDEHNIEIAGGFGQFAGKIFRIGLMGYGAQRNNVLLVLATLEKVLGQFGFRAPAGAGVVAAERVYASVPEPAGVRT
jgi:alanine-glyoxylate transaminase/serine-glyoxylate transaminase/serine-pyruvate transaminase